MALPLPLKDPPDQVNSGRSLRDKVRNEVLAGVSETTSLVRVASTSLISWTCVCLCVYVCSVNLSLSLSFSLALSLALCLSLILSLSQYLVYLAVREERDGLGCWCDSLVVLLRCRVVLALARIDGAERVML